MEISGQQILIISLILYTIIVTCGFMKLLLSDKTLLTLSIVTLIIAVFGLLIRSEQTQMVNGNGATFLIAPFIYTISYLLLRKLYKFKYKIEPTYNRRSWYDSEDNRNQNLLDVTVHILPMLLGFIIPLTYDKCF